MTLLYVLVAILLLCLLIVVHEFGHFFFARITGIEVREFSVGFGPQLLSHTTKKGLKVSLRAVPLGGYCAFYGEDDIEGKTEGDPRAYNRQPVWKRMISVLMGPGMNFILAFVVAVAFFGIGGVQSVIGYTPYVYEVNAAGPAYDAGLQSGDIISEINGVSMLDGTTETLLSTIKGYQSGDDPLHLTILRTASDGTVETIEKDMTPLWDDTDQVYRIGVTISAQPVTETVHLSFGETVSYSWDCCVYYGGAILKAVKSLVSSTAAWNDTAGPVGTVALISETVQTSGFQSFIELLIMISINLGIMNLLPIPGLDGARFLFMIVEAIRRKPVNPKVEASIHLAGYFLLFALMIFLTCKDVINLF